MKRDRQEQSQLQSVLWIVVVVGVPVLTVYVIAPLLAGRGPYVVLGAGVLVGFVGVVLVAVARFKR